MRNVYNKNNKNHGHARDVRKTIVAGMNIIPYMTTRWDFVDKYECQRGFSCHKGMPYFSVFAPRKNQCKFREKRVYFLESTEKAQKNSISTEDIALWIYDNKVHAYIKCIFDVFGNVFFLSSYEDVDLHFMDRINSHFCFSKQEWSAITKQIITHICENIDTFEYHMFLDNIPGTPHLRGNAPTIDTNQTRFSLLQQHWSNNDGCYNSVSSSVVNDDVYWMHHSKQERLHGFRPAPSKFRTHEESVHNMNILKNH